MTELIAEDGGLSRPSSFLIILNIFLNVSGIVQFVLFATWLLFVYVCEWILDLEND